MAVGLEERKRLEEIHEINRHFLELIVLHTARERAGKYGLSADLCERIRDLGASQLDVLASVPLLLVTATRRAVEQAGNVRDMERERPRIYDKNDVAEQTFTAALMTWLTQDAQQHHSLASLWLGTEAGEGEPLRELNFDEIQKLAPYADTILNARFADRPKLWLDLIRAAESDDPRRHQIARLAVLPHSYPITKKPPPGAGRRRKR
ncbi:MAG: hypothetical protein OXI11_11105 [Gammaproteobacteria bacterium]|nr:hypothetical protein [Gammaproteobacteria bacterium]MXW45906.1 hypothetical protein [Gammaproteobacteria bacterium]MYD00774.1 hypothetical protein [Gammaproteobacteria bacterium]MYI25438.1 hypothetical protein [Gammaproteobacteria bacterium]